MKMNHPQAPKKQTQNKPNFFKGQNELKIACQKIRPNPWQTAFGGLSIVLKHKKSRPRSGGNNWSSCIYCMLSLALTIKELVCFFQAENRLYDTPRNEDVL